MDELQEGIQKMEKTIAEFKKQNARIVVAFFLVGVSLTAGVWFGRVGYAPRTDQYVQVRTAVQQADSNVAANDRIALSLNNKAASHQDSVALGNAIKLRWYWTGVHDAFLMIAQDSVKVSK